MHYGVRRMRTSPDITVAVETSDPESVRIGEQLAKRLGCAISTEIVPPTGLLLLVFTGQRLELRDHESKRRGVFADFASIDPRTRAGKGSRSQPLAKAIGRTAHTVVDATAGLGHDSALLALLGYDVLALERSPIIAALCEDGLRRALMDELMSGRLKDHLRIINADARAHLLTMKPRPDVVYIDPMFPPKRKASALAKKSIRLVRAVVGDDVDAAELLKVARSVARERVIVKRPTHAEPLAPKPSVTYEGTLVRYDVYRI